MRIGLVVVNHASASDALVAINSARHALEGILSRVIVVENGTGEAAQFRERGLDVIDLGENRGFAAGVNAGVEWLWHGLPAIESALILNPDAYLLDGPWLAWTANPGGRIAAKGPCILTGAGDVQSSCYREPDPDRMVLEAMGVHRLAGRFGWRRRMPPRRAEAASVQGSCMMLTRAAWKEVGAFDEGFFLYHEETDWCLRARDRGFEVIYDPSVSVIHEKGECVPAGREMVYYRSTVRLIEKRQGRNAAERLRARLRRAARLAAFFTSDDARRRGLGEVAAKL